jgi:hypothetical protein
VLYENEVPTLLFCIWIATFAYFGTKRPNPLRLAVSLGLYSLLVNQNVWALPSYKQCTLAIGATPVPRLALAHESSSQTISYRDLSVRRVFAYRGGNCNGNQRKAGAFIVHLNDAPSNSNWNIGSAQSYLFLE